MRGDVVAEEFRVTWVVVPLVGALEWEVTARDAATCLRLLRGLRGMTQGLTHLQLGWVPTLDDGWWRVSGSIEERWAAWERFEAMRETVGRRSSTAASRLRGGFVEEVHLSGS